MEYRWSNQTLLSFKKVTCFFRGERRMCTGFEAFVWTMLKLRVCVRCHALATDTRLAWTPRRFSARSHGPSRKSLFGSGPWEPGHEPKSGWEFRLLIRDKHWTYLPSTHFFTGQECSLWQRYIWGRPTVEKNLHSFQQSWEDVPDIPGIWTSKGKQEERVEVEEGFPAHWAGRHLCGGLCFVCLKDQCLLWFALLDVWIQIKMCSWY